MRHIIKASQFSRSDLEHIFATAESLRGTRDNSLQGKILLSMFYEPSTRTRWSFASAMYRLGGHVITTENAKEFSSAVKGETLEDTVRVVSNYGDYLVLRHSDDDSAERAAAVSTIPVLNAGSGKNEHPTQALLDLFTIQDKLGSLDGTHLLVSGDLKYGRTARSLIQMIGLFDDVKVSCVSPRGLEIGEDIISYCDGKGIPIDTYHSLQEAPLESAYATYMTRPQLERMNKEDTAIYESKKHKYILTLDETRRLPWDGIILHPLPRNEEIAVEVDNDPRAVYLDAQVESGVLVRMAVLKLTA